ncbi:MAG TPA: pyruvate oxidoreductase [Peptococcaceae bacterium]|nr:pyruvate oxidoreductase [Peptococcaceae bacterium]
MVEVRFHGRFGQPVGKITRAMGKKLMAEGKHIQVFDGFAAFRPGAPMNSTIRVSEDVIVERSANETTPDVVVVLDNSLFGVTDVTKGLKPNGVVLALGVNSDVLGPKAQNVKFIQLDSEFDRGGEPEEELLKAFKKYNIL